MKKVKVLVTCRYEFVGSDCLGCYNSYIDALYKNDMIPVLWARGNKEDIEQVIDSVDGVLISGGADIDSKYYNEPLDPTAGLEPDYIDQSDLDLIEVALKHNKPILGICRGIQIINVYFGGSLYQDLNTSGLNLQLDYHNQRKHNPPKGTNDLAHKAFFMEGSQIYKICGNEAIVNSFHHQALKKVAEPLIITGMSDDGVIEAVEYPGKILAVQWHPERLTHIKEHNEIFVEFKKMCSC